MVNTLRPGIKVKLPWVLVPVGYGTVVVPRDAKPGYTRVEIGVKNGRAVRRWFETALLRPLVPVPVKTESRICFGIAYFTDHTDATAFALSRRDKGDTYNGGFFHGMPCGRDSSFDYTDPALGPLYAVTTR